MDLVTWVVLGIALAVGFYMAWNIGANDLANAMGTSVGSGALTIKRAVILAAVLNLFGAVLVGSHVTETVRHGIIKVEMISNMEILVAGMFASILASAIWITIATYFGLPISTTHSIVGSIAGFGLVVIGIKGVAWDVVGNIALSWLISPLAGAIIAFTVFMIIKKAIFDAKFPLDRTRKIAPFMVALVFTILALSMIYKGLKGLSLELPIEIALPVSLFIGSIAGFISLILLRRFQPKGKDDYAKVERVFNFLQIMTAGYVAFAHGANDVANAAGPLASIVGYTVYNLTIEKTVALPQTAMIALLSLGGIGIAIGTATWGIKVVEMVGKRITEITPTRGFSAEFGAATTVLACSKLGMPISTTHTLVGAVIGVGFARGIKALDLRVIRNIVFSWLITLPASALIAIGIYKGIEMFM